MVTTIPPAPSFDLYYGLNNTPVSCNSGGTNTTTVILLGGFILMTAISAYLLIKNNDLSEKIKRTIPRQLDDN